MPSTTTRLALIEAVGSDNPAELRLAILNHAATLDAATTYTEATISGLSASKAGRLLRATDTHQWLLDNGVSLDIVQLFPMGYLKGRSGTGTISAAAGDLIFAAAGSTVNLPSSPVDGQVFGVFAGSTASGASPVTISAPSSFGTPPLAGPGFRQYTIELGQPWGFAIVQYIAAANQFQLIAGRSDTGWVSGLRVIGDRAYGATTITIPNGSASAVTTVSHGLETTPTWAICGGSTGGTTLAGVTFFVTSLTSTQIQLFAVSTTLMSGAQTFGVHWQAML